MTDDEISYFAASGAKQQKDLFLIRSRARTREVERRSRANQHMDAQEEFQEKQKERADAAYVADSAGKLRRAEDTIVQLLRNNAAFQKTIDRLTDAWGDKKEEAMKGAQAILDEATKSLENDTAFLAKSKAWANSRLSPKYTDPVAKPAVQGRKPKP